MSLHGPAQRRIAATAAVMAALLLMVGTAHGEVPTTRDVAECNHQARQGSGVGAPSPNQKDESGAEGARSARPGAVERLDATGRSTRSPDPQIDGMDSGGAKDPAFRAAYRTCMRKKGF
jgi:hypothetical protein